MPSEYCGGRTANSHRRLYIDILFRALREKAREATFEYVEIIFNRTRLHSYLVYMIRFLPPQSRCDFLLRHRISPALTDVQDGDELQLVNPAEYYGNLCLFLEGS